MSTTENCGLCGIKVSPAAAPVDSLVTTSGSALVRSRPVVEAFASTLIQTFSTVALAMPRLVLEYLLVAVEAGVPILLRT